MLDGLREQEKDTRLFETVCRSLLSDKEFRRVSARRKFLLYSEFNTRLIHSSCV